MAQEYTIRPGVMVEGYRVEGEIGQGGVGVIYAGIHPVIRKRVAIKVLGAQFASDPVAVQRFVLEARSVNEIRHHNIVDIFAMGQLPDGRTYLVMDLLDGADLDEILRDIGRMRAEHLVPLLAQMCDALSATHAKGFIHRDLKPGNVVVLRRPPFPQIKLLDFGLAKLRGGNGDEVTAAGTVLGTPQYMAPEQCRGEQVDPRTDVYALGIMLFELLTGVRPFDAPGPLTVLEMQMSQRPPRPSSLVSLPRGLDRVVLTALNKTPAGRFPSVSALLAALRHVVGEGAAWQTSDRPGPPMPLPKVGRAGQDPVQPPSPLPEVVVPLDQVMRGGWVGEEPTLVDGLPDSVPAMPNELEPVDDEANTDEVLPVMDTTEELPRVDTDDQVTMEMALPLVQPSESEEPTLVETLPFEPSESVPGSARGLDIVVEGTAPAEHERPLLLQNPVRTRPRPEADDPDWQLLSAKSETSTGIGPMLVEVSTDEVHMEDTGVFRLRRPKNDEDH